MYLIQGRFALALGFSTAAHVGLAWMVSDQLPSGAAPAQRALTVAMTPAAPRAVLNSIAPTATAALSPAVVRPLAPVSVQAIHEPDRVVAARVVDIVQALDAPLVEARGPKRHLRARDSRASTVALVAAVSRMRISSALLRETEKKPLPASLDPAPATSREVLPAPRAAATTPAPQSVDGKPGTGGQAHSPRAVAGQPGANREALPASGNEPPEYPWIARAQGHQGRVLISVWVGAEGQADELAVLQSSGYPNLDRAAVEAVRHWRFQPARRGGIETGSLLYVPVVFRLDE